MLRPRESADLPASVHVDPAIAADSDPGDVSVITLSDRLHPAKDGAPERESAAAAPAAKSPEPAAYGAVALAGSPPVE